MNHSEETAALKHEVKEEEESEQVLAVSDACTDAVKEEPNEEEDENEDCLDDSWRDNHSPATSDNQRIVEELSSSESDDESEYMCKWANCKKKQFTKKSHRLHVIQVHVASTENLTCQWKFCRSRRTYKCKKSLDAHVRSHFGSVYKCTVKKCGKRYTCHASFIRHFYKKHPGVKPFKCKEADCKETFLTVVARERHKAQVHCSEDAHFCPIKECGKVFFTRRAFNNHIEKAHANEVTQRSVLFKKDLKRARELSDGKNSETKKDKPKTRMRAEDLPSSSKSAPDFTPEDEQKLVNSILEKRRASDRRILPRISEISRKYDMQRCLTCQKRVHASEFHDHYESLHTYKFAENAPIRCEYCESAYFYSRGGLATHLNYFCRARHMPRPEHPSLFTKTSCPVCLLEFRSAYDMSDHLFWSHVPERGTPLYKKFIEQVRGVFQCVNCKVSFRTAHQLGQHFLLENDPCKMTVVISEIFFELSQQPEDNSLYGPQGTKTFYDFQRDIADHDYICAFCGIFGTQDAETMKSHAKECSRDDHMRKKYNSYEPFLTPVRCEFCLAKFATYYDVSQHLRRKHPMTAGDKKYFRCSACPDCSFSTASRLAKHLLGSQRSERIQNSGSCGGHVVTPTHQECCEMSELMTVTEKQHARKERQMDEEVWGIAEKRIKNEEPPQQPAIVSGFTFTQWIQDGRSTVQSVCPVCEKSHFALEQLDEHMRAEHPNDPFSYKCGGCFETFIDASDLRSHQLQARSKSNLLCSRRGIPVLTGRNPRLVSIYPRLPPKKSSSGFG